MVLRSHIPMNKHNKIWGEGLEIRIKGKILLPNLYAHLGNHIKIWSLMECFSNTELLLQKGETGQEGTTNHIVV